MSWRTVVISQRCKLDLNSGYMVIRGETETKKIFLEEVSMLIIENPAVSLTGCLLASLSERKIKVILCDTARNPTAELVPYHGCHDCSRKINAQIGWDGYLKKRIWREIVSDKIQKQADFLYDLGHRDEGDLLVSYLSQIEPGDTTNREGHAAKVYFNALFGMKFTRSEECITNSALNYGYGILLSVFNREIVANGYLTQLGIFHDNVFNHFNLSCDLMEPFRILVDRHVTALHLKEFGSSEKHSVLAFLNNDVRIDNTVQTLINAVKIYVRSVFDALNDGEPAKIKRYSI